MNAVEKAISEIKNSIPYEILQETFGRHTVNSAPGVSPHRQVPVSLDYQIRQHVLNPRVIVDCNLSGGTEVDIPMMSLIPNNVTPWVTTYTVPKQLTQGRSISRVVSMTIGQGSVLGTTNMGLQGSSALMDAASGVLAGVLPIPIISTAYIQLIGENTLLIDDNMALPNDVWLRCALEFDSNFTQLPKPYYHAFAELCIHAVKAYIYKSMVIEMGMAQLSGGQELGRFKEIVDGYADSNQNYYDYLEEKWTVTQKLADPQQKRRHLSMLVGGNW